LRAATPAGGSNIDGDNAGTGLVAGVNFGPNPGTANHEREVISASASIPTRQKLVGFHVFETSVEAEIDLPDKLTFSFRQAVSPRARLLGTVDWANWSPLGVIPIRLGGPFPPLETGESVANIVFNWQDGWMFALGGEFDWSPRLTLRTSVSYEISPVDGATTRLVQVPNSDHTWTSVGAPYRLSDNSSIDFAYSHGFFALRTPPGGDPVAERPAPDWRGECQRRRRFGRLEMELGRSSFRASAAEIGIASERRAAVTTA
jgi:long-chain fatty acid transport protein